jgi:hypothetical protein
VKGAVQEIEKSQAEPTTVRPKQKQPQAELQKLQVHAGDSDPLSEEEPEYCPPKPKDLPYESDVFPKGVLTYEALKPENLFKGYYDYYINPVDEDGVSLGDRKLAERNRKAMVECDRRVQKDMDDFDWSVSDVPETKDYFKKSKQPAPDAEPTKSKENGKKVAGRKPLSTITSRNAARALSINEGTKSMQRKAVKAIPTAVPKRRVISAIPGLRAVRKPVVPPTAMTRKTSMEIRAIEAHSRATIGHNKGRAVSSALANRATKPVAKSTQHRPKAAEPTHSEAASSTEWDKTITPARYAHKQASTVVEDEQWKERVPFLSIFNTEDEDDCDVVGSGFPGALDDDDEFEMQLPE